jgi:hypothetical protein
MLQPVELYVDEVPNAGISFVEIRIVSGVQVIVEVKHHPIAIGGANPSLIESGNDEVFDRSEAISLREIAIPVQVVSRIEQKRASAAGLGALACPLALRGVIVWSGNVSCG